jgi:DNA-binding beta-propeller fold protein YncE
MPRDAVYDPQDSGILYYVDNCYPIMFVIDDITERIIQEVEVPGECPPAVDVNPTTNMIYVLDTCFGSSGTLSIFENGAYEQIGEIDLSSLGCLNDIAVSPAINRIYIADSCDPTLHFVDATNVTSLSINDTGYPGQLDDIGFNPVTNEIYAVNRDEEQVIIVNEKTGAKNEFEFNNINNISIDPPTSELYLSYGKEWKEGNMEESIRVLNSLNRSTIAEIPLVTNTPQNCC